MGRVRDRDLVTAADAAVGNTFPYMVKMALSIARKRLFLFWTDKGTGSHVVSGHVFPVDADPDIYAYKAPGKTCHIADHQTETSTKPPAYPAKK